MVTPAGKKSVVVHLIACFRLSERRACQLVGLSRTAYRHHGALSRDDALIKRLKELAVAYPRYGYLMLHELLKREGLVVIENALIDCIGSFNCKYVPRKGQS